MSKKTKFHSFSIPNTVRHVPFLNEVYLALKTAKIPYTKEIEDNYVEQLSEVHFFTKTQHDCDLACALTEMVSVRTDTPETLGRKILAMRKKKQKKGKS